MSCDIRRSASELTLNIPPECHNKDINVSVKTKKETVPKELTFRSFMIVLNGDVIILGGKYVGKVHLYNLLVAHGMDGRVPILVKLGPLKYDGIDWNPMGCHFPNTWEFTWRDIRCAVTSNRPELLWIRVYDMTPGVGEKVLEEMSEELLKHWVDPVPLKSLSVYTPVEVPGGYKWHSHSTRLQRAIDTIYIDESNKRKVVDGIAKFLRSADMYDRFGITWKRVHLFHGAPGCGKTSMVLAVCSLYNKSIAKLTLSPHMTGQHLEYLFTSVPDNTWIILEDVDALFTGRVANQNVDFSTLLNCLDGITTTRGLVVFMTTNHYDKLDPAFIRPGRIDLALEFIHPGINELRMALKTLAPKYAHEHDTYLALPGNDKLTIPALQRHVFECVMDERESML